LEAAEKAMGIDPDCLLAWTNRAQALLRDHPSRALADLEHVLEREPGNAFARMVRTAALGNLGRYAEALKESDDLLSRFPNDGLLHSNRGLVLLALQRYEEALEEYRTAGPLAAGDDWVDGAMCALAALGRFEEALEMAGLAKKDLHSVAEASVFCLRALGRTEEARELAAWHCRTAETQLGYLCAVAGLDEQARKLAAEGHGFPVLSAQSRANCFAVLRDREMTLKWLGKAIEAGFRPERSKAMHELAWLREDPAYQALVSPRSDRDKDE
jgi:tetratricopeptide (TPR) repeat protein